MFRIKKHTQLGSHFLIRVLSILSGGFKFNNNKKKTSIAYEIDRTKRTNKQTNNKNILYWLTHME